MARSSIRYARWSLALAWSAMQLGLPPQAGAAGLDDPRETAAAVRELRAGLDAQQAIVARQRDQIDAQLQEIAHLRQRLEALELAAHAEAAPGAAQPPAVEQRLDAIEQALHRLPELPEHVVVTGEFPGSFEVPGTGSSVRLGGLLRSTIIHTLGPLGSDDRFIASSIPVGDELAGQGSRTAYTAAPSRLNLDVRSRGRLGDVRAFAEGDFAGAGNTARLRHAFIQTRRFVFGQTWSTFSDPEVQPIDIDFEGENAVSRFRQAQLRYTRPLASHVDLSIAAENPAPAVTGAEGVNLTPDGIVRVRWEPQQEAHVVTSGAAHVQGAVLVRTLRAELSGSADEKLSTAGAGGSVSGVLVPRWKREDRVKFSAIGGWGIGRYLTDLAAIGGQDAVYDASRHELRALPVAAGYVGYEHQWTPSLLSAFTFGMVSVSNLDIQPLDALHRTQRASVNLTWNPIRRADVVIEFLAGERVNKDGSRGRSSQVQAGWKLRF